MFASKTYKEIRKMRKVADGLIGMPFNSPSFYALKCEHNYRAHDVSYETYYTRTCIPTNTEIRLVNLEKGVEMVLFFDWNGKLAWARVIEA